MAITATCTSGSLLPLTRTPGLTTIFTPPAFCSSRFHTGTSGAPTSYGWQDEVDPLWYSCIPPEWDAAACQSLTFSPALQCPHGWTINTSKSVLGPSRSSITFATCCMSGFTAALFTDGEKCVANVINFPLVVLATNASNSGRYASPLATSVGMTTLEKGFVDHRGIVIGWEEKDLTSFSSTAKPTGSVSPAAAGEDSERRLPAGAIAGIVVGSVVWVAGMVGSIILWRRKRRRMAGSTGRHELQTDRTPEMFSPLGPPPPTGENKQLYGSPPVRRYELPVGSEGPAGDVYEMPSR